MRVTPRIPDSIPGPTISVQSPPNSFAKTIIEGTGVLVI
jgi:hypothetical protein